MRTRPSTARPLSALARQVNKFGNGRSSNQVVAKSMANVWQRIVLCTIDDQTAPRSKVGLERSSQAICVTLYSEALFDKEFSNSIVRDNLLEAKFWICV